MQNWRRYRTTNTGKSSDQAELSMQNDWTKKKFISSISVRERIRKELIKLRNINTG
jgi:hypothetical protein